MAIVTARTGMPPQAVLHERELAALRREWEPEPYCYDIGFLPSDGMWVAFRITDPKPRGLWARTPGQLRAEIAADWMLREGRS